ncbi:hypothetical protein [Microbulbifer sp. SAOS-129_SWC]|uniref:hypothetical protein n=1 Tax=Microbulbifer sp. SAOS-129_SWC TaxID=3145235 RepID=UPI003216C8B2
MPIKLPLNKPALWCLPLLLLLLCWRTTHAASTNTDPCGDGSGASGDNVFIGVCNLNGASHDFIYDATVQTQGSIDFQIRSCGPQKKTVSCKKAAAFWAAVDDDNSSGSNYLLYNAYNQTLPINLFFGNKANNTNQLVPNQTYGGTSPPFSGAANGKLSNYFLRVELAPPGLTGYSGIYSGTFYFSMQQESFCDKTGNNCTTELVRLPFTVTVTVTPVIKISGLTDVASALNTSGDTVMEDDFCVYNLGGGYFKMQADSTVGTGEFLLQGPVTQIPYSVEIADTGGSQSEVLTEGDDSTTNWLGSDTNINCNANEENMHLTVRISLNDALAAESGSYQDTLTLTVTPQ